MIRLFSLHKGTAGTLETLKAMRIVALEGTWIPDIRAVADQVTPRDYEELMRRYWRFAEEYEETLRPIESQVQSLRSDGIMLGDCDDAATVVAAVALVAGLPVRFVATRRGPDNAFTHVFDEIAIEQAGNRTMWLRVDPTAPLDANYNGWERLVQDV